MIRNEIEYRNAKEQIGYLRAELENLNVDEREDISRAVTDALMMKIEDIERELSEYEALKSGSASEFEANSLDELGEIVTKARIARGWSQTDLAKALEVKPQQVQRYESNDWQKISLWRLQEVTEALNLYLSVQAHLDKPEAERPGTLWHRMVPDLWHTTVKYDESALTVKKKDEGLQRDRPAVVSGQGSADWALTS